MIARKNNPRSARLPAKRSSALAVASEQRPKVASDELAAELSFWYWAIRERGIGHFWRGLGYHAIVGAVLAYLIPGKLSAIAMAVMLPLAAILIGLAVSWSSTATTLMQTDELRKVGLAKDGEFTAERSWAFWYQSIIWVILVTTTMWSLVAAGVLDNWLIGEVCPWWLRLIGRAVILMLSSLSVRESWQVVVAAQQKLLGFLRLKRDRLQSQNDNNSEPPQRG